jgi:hypothetical protein
VAIATTRVVGLAYGARVSVFGHSTDRSGRARFAVGACVMTVIGGCTQRHDPSSDNAARGPVATSVTSPVGTSVASVAVSGPAASSVGTPFDPADLAQAFVIEHNASYFGRNDFLLVVRSREASIDLVESPQDVTVSFEPTPIGHFRADLPPAVRASIGALLPVLLTPMPVSSGHHSPGDAPVMDAPSWGVTVERGGVRTPLRAPATHDVPEALLDLLRDARTEARKHPVEAIRITAALGHGDFLFQVESVGSAPVKFANPLSFGPDARGLKLFRWDDSGATSAQSNTQIAFRDGPRDAGATITLKPGEHFALHSVPWPPIGPQPPDRYVALAAEWSDPGEPGMSAGVFRVRGFARSPNVMLTPAPRARTALEPTP